MAEEPKVVLKLKEPMLSLEDGEPIPDLNTLDISQEEAAKLTNSELKKKVKPLTKGTALIRVISSKKEQKPEETADIYRLIVKIRNKMLTDKGEWHMSAEEIKSVIEHIKKAEGQIVNPAITGQLLINLEELELDLRAKTKN